MNINSPASVAAVVTKAVQAKVGSAVETLVLKKALEIETQNAMQLISAIPEVSASPTGTVGGHINTTA